jgi:hypothetical protein
MIMKCTLQTLALVALIGFSSVSTAQMKPCGMARIEGTEVAVNYEVTTPGNTKRMFRLEIQPRTNQLTLGIDAEAIPSHAVATKILKAEVLRLTKGRTGLGNTGVIFHMKDGYPIWGPHQTIGPCENQHKIQFANDAALTHGVLSAFGVKKGDIAFDGYTQQTDFQ